MDQIAKIKTEVKKMGNFYYIPIKKALVDAEVLKIGKKIEIVIKDVVSAIRTHDMIRVYKSYGVKA